MLFLIPTKFFITKFEIESIALPAAYCGVRAFYAEVRQPVLFTFQNEYAN